MVAGLLMLVTKVISFAFALLIKLHPAGITINVEDNETLLIITSYDQQAKSDRKKHRKSRKSKKHYQHELFDSLDYSSGISLRDDIEANSL